MENLTFNQFLQVEEHNSQFLNKVFDLFDNKIDDPKEIVKIERKIDVIVKEKELSEKDELRSRYDI